MKKLTTAELIEAPDLIKGIIIDLNLGNVIPPTIMEEAQRDHPEYFPDEIAYKECWSEIPTSVHDEFMAALKLKVKMIDIQYPVNDMESMELRNVANEEARNILFDKFYKPYLDPQEDEQAQGNM